MNSFNQIFGDDASIDSIYILAVCCDTLKTLLVWLGSWLRYAVVTMSSSSPAFRAVIATFVDCLL
jgi:hypothetical protein